MTTDKNQNHIPVWSLPPHQIVRIQENISQKNYNSFDKNVKEPLSIELQKMLQFEYPKLVHEKSFIINGVLRRIKNDIKKYNPQEDSSNIYSKVEQYFFAECQALLPNLKNRNNNLGLTKREFDLLQIALKNGDESLIEKMYLSNMKNTIGIIIKRTQCKKEEAYQASMEALLEIRSDLLNDRIRYGNLKSYFTTRAIKIFYKSKSKKKIVQSKLTPEMEFIDDSKFEESLIERDLNRIIRKSINKLGPDCQSILKWHYYQNQKMSEIAIRLEKSHEAVRKQASRCRTTLKRILGGKFYRQFSSHFS